LGSSIWAMMVPLVSSADGKVLSDFDSSIESINSQEFSVGIFYFLIASIFVFTIFIFMYMFQDKASKLKKGEKVLFAWILFGVVVAIIFGASQLLHGYLF
jgi:prolipoprotein diacylglyceryltransferase